LPIGNGGESNDNLANNASPFIVQPSLTVAGNPFIFFDNHSTNSLYVDINPLSEGSGGLLGTPLPVKTTSGETWPIGTGGFGDVTAASAIVSGTSGIYFVDFLNNSGQITILSAPVSSGDPSGSFTYLNALTSIGGHSINVAYTPTLVSFNSTLYMAFVSGQSIYLASSKNGTSFSLVSSTALSPVSISRPALAVFNGNLYIAYTTTPENEVVSGPLFDPSNISEFEPSLTTYAWRLGYKSSNGVWAGVALVAYGGSLYLEGQSVASSQYLFSTDSTSGTDFPYPVQCNAQFRWTPSGIADQFAVSGLPVLVYQSPGSTQVELQY
jgi:hypothetical protein